MNYTKQEFMAGLDRLGERDARTLLKSGAVDGDEAQWITEWLTRDRLDLRAPQANEPQPVQEPPAVEEPRPYNFRMAS